MAPSCLYRAHEKAPPLTEDQQLAKARSEAQGLKELDDDMRERNGRMLQHIAALGQSD